MKYEVLSLFPQNPQANLICYLHRDADELQCPPHPAIIVCPGGGYTFLSEREDEPIALAYMAAGFQAFCLHYGICEHAANYEPLIEACLAIRYVRTHAKELNVDPHRIFITGFSAGGHLAASAGVLWNHSAVVKALSEQYGEEDSSLCRPDGMILCYPVITSGEHAHRGSFLALCGDQNATPEQQAAFSLERLVDEHCCPAFVWHTANDAVVPVENSLLLTQALAAHNIPFELHVYPDGPHGLALCDERTRANNPAFVNPTAAAWVAQSIRWAKQL